jgi:hypothetical protein
MMLKAREHRGSITHFGRAFSEVQHLIPTEEEWATCEVIERVLEPFYDFTRSVSKDQPCLPESIGIIWGLDDLLDDVSKKEGQFGDVGDDIQEAFQAGVAQIDEYTKLINENIMYYAAAVLDPRIKCNLIKEQCDNPNGVIEKVRKYLKEEFHQSEALEAPLSSVELPHGVNQHQIGLLRRARKSTSCATCDIDRYLNTDSVDWDELDPSNYKPDWVLNWWRANATQFPMMAKAAHALLAVPGSEVDIERLFYGGRDLLGIRRYSLKGETMRILTTLKAHFERKLNQGQAKLPEVSTALSFPNWVVQS